MPVFEFGGWSPDAADYNNPGVETAKNVLPARRGYLPMPDLSVVTDAIASRPTGAMQGVDKDSNIFQYVGDSSKLYENIGDSWTDRSKSGGYSTTGENRWEFVQWQNKMLAVNYDDNPQQITFGGSAFSDLTTVFQARHISVIRDFAVVGNTNDSSDGMVTERVRWSAVDDETDWTVSASTLSDFQDLKRGGPVNQIVGGQFGVVFQQDSTWRMTFVGSPTVFQFDEVLPGIGTIGPQAAVKYGNFIYFLSERGFFELRNGTTVRPIGADRIDKFVLDDIDNSYLRRISTAVDRKYIYWAYAGSGNTGGRPNKIVVYDRTLDKWSLIEKDVEQIWMASGRGKTLEELDSESTPVNDLDNLPFSLDSDAWKGGKRTLLAAFDSNFKSGFWDGNDMTATIKTGELELVPGRQAHLNAFRHVIDGGTTTAKVGSRNNQADSISQSSAITERTSNIFPTRTNARYHQFEFSISGGFTQAIGMQIEKNDVRTGGRRGI